jgi:hypothetical protein
VEVVMAKYTLTRAEAIVGGVYAYEKLLSGRPSMPNVVPRIGRECTEALLKVLTASPGDAAIRQLQREADGCMDTVMGQRRKVSLLRKIELVKKNLKPTSESEARAQVANLALMRGVKEVWVASPWVYIETAPVFIEAHPCHLRLHPRRWDEPSAPDAPGLKAVYLGRYRVGINMEERVFPHSIVINRLANNSSTALDPGEYIHPHVSRWSTCWGSYADIMEKELHRGQLDSMASMLVRYCAVANKDSYMRHLAYFKPGGLYSAVKLDGPFKLAGS